VYLGISLHAPGASSCSHGCGVFLALPGHPVTPVHFMQYLRFRSL
jgi:hypothetical protein